MAEGVSMERGGTVPAGDSALGAVGTCGMANSMLEGSPDVRAVVGVAVVGSDGVVAETADTDNASAATERAAEAECVSGNLGGSDQAVVTRRPGVSMAPGNPWAVGSR